MGRVRPTFIKRLGNKFVEEFPEEFGTDFYENRKILKETNLFKSKTLRNRVAGYIVRIVKNKKF